MARIPRTHNARSLRVWPGANDDTPGGAAVPLTATAYSNPVSMGGLEGLASFHLIWTGASGALVGTFFLQMSLVGDPDLANDSDWVTITAPILNGTSLAIASNDGNSVISMPYGAFPEWLRIKFGYTSGTGTVRAYARVTTDR